MNLQSFRRRVGGPYALSRWSVILPLVLLPLLRLADPGLRVGGHLATYLGATLAGMSLVAVGAALARSSYLRTEGRGPRPAAALGTFFILGAVRVAGVAGAEAVFGVPLSRPILPELVIGGLQGTVVLAIIAVWVDSQRQYTQVHRRLSRVKDEIDAWQRLTNVRTDELLISLAVDVEHEVDSRRAVAGSDRSAAAVARALRAVSEEYVRPLSHRVEREWLVDRLALVAGGVASEPTATERRARPGSVRTFVRELRAPSPALVTAIMMLLATGTLLRIVGPSETIAILVGAGVVMVVGGRLVGSAMRAAHGHPVVLSALLVIGSAGVAAVSVVVDYAMVALLTGDGAWLSGGIFTYTFVAVVVSLGATAVALAERSQDVLAAQVVEKAAMLDRSSLRLDQLREVTARFLHGAVQAELVASALLVEREASSGHPVDAVLREAYARIADQVESACADIDVPGDVRFRRHLEFWRQVCDLHCRVDASCWTVIAARPAAATALGRVLAEGMTNAIRHGGPGRMELTLAVAGQEAVTLTLVSPGYLDDDRDGGQPVDRFDPGLGLSAIDAVSSQWSLVAEDGLVSLRVLV